MGDPQAAVPSSDEEAAVSGVTVIHPRDDDWAVRRDYGTEPIEGREDGGAQAAPDAEAPVCQGQGGIEHDGLV